MFPSRHLATLVLVVTVMVLALSTAHPTSGAAREELYVVRPGDTLWALAAARYAGDPREAIWRIKQRNGLERSHLSPGAVLVLPAR